MIESLDDVKQLVIWAKNVGLKKLKIGEVEFELSDMALTEKYADLPEMSNEPANSAKTGPLKDSESKNSSSKTWIDTADFSEDDEAALFHSVR